MGFYSRYVLSVPLEYFRPMTMVCVQSLKTSLTNLHNPLTSSLLLRAIPTLITLITLTTSPGSAARFDKLCEVLGDGIIGNVWMYAYNEPESILASLNVLPLLIEALGIGSVRYSKVGHRLLSIKLFSNINLGFHTPISTSTPPYRPIHQTLTRNSAQLSQSFTSDCEGMCTADTRMER